MKWIKEKISIIKKLKMIIRNRNRSNGTLPAESRVSRRNNTSTDVVFQAVRKLFLLLDLTQSTPASLQFLLSARGLGIIAYAGLLRDRNVLYHQGECKVGGIRLTAHPRLSYHSPSSLWLARTRYARTGPVWRQSYHCVPSPRYPRYTFISQTECEGI